MGAAVYLTIAGVLWVFMCFAVFALALLKRRSPLGWLIYGLVISPVALIHLLMMPGLATADAQRVASDKKRRCHFCGEPNEPEAKTCTHCLLSLPPQRPH